MIDLEKQKSLFVALIGAPNSGKSTFLNHILKNKISIVSPKPQTTRKRICGIYTHEDTQIVFTDTPGIFNSSNKRQDKWVDEALLGIDEAEEVLFIADIAKIVEQGKIDRQSQHAIEKLQDKGKKALLILNKIDKVKSHLLLEWIQVFSQNPAFKEIFPISAKSGKGVENLTSFLSKQARPAPWGYDPEQISDSTVRAMAEEITREKVFYLLKDEIPFGVEVETEKFEETETQINIYQNILVPKQSHKNIIVGKNASLIKKIGQKSRIEIQQSFEEKVNLFLFVKLLSKTDVKNRGY